MYELAKSAMSTSAMPVPTAHAAFAAQLHTPGETNDERPDREPAAQLPDPGWSIATSPSHEQAAGASRDRLLSPGYAALNA